MKKAETNLIEVILGKPHTHEGVQHKPGEKLKVSPDTAKWLDDNGITATGAAETTEDA